MFKNLLLVSLVLLVSITATGQDGPFGIPGNLVRAKRIPCGTTPNYIAAHGTDTSGSSGSFAITAPGSFPSSAIDTCGVFKIYYEDRAASRGAGFDAPGSVGAARRALLCDVLSYVQSVIDFSSMASAGKYIRLNVDLSYDGAYPAGAGVKYLAAATPGYIVGPGVKNGYIYDYLKTGTDPAPSTDYHAKMEVNFDAVDTGKTTAKMAPINYYIGTGTIGNCDVDLYGVLLHEIGHALGWISFVDMGIVSGPTRIRMSGLGMYSGLDTFVSIGSFGSLTRVVTPGSTFTKYFDFDTVFWLNSKLPPDNYPVAVVENTLDDISVNKNLAHMDDIYHSYSERQRISPGDWHDFVMGPYSFEGVAVRTFSKCEIKMLQDLGYPLKSTYTSAPVVSNSVPYSKRMGSRAYTLLWRSISFNSSWAEYIPADVTVTNDSGTVVTINLAADTTLLDRDGDTIKVFPGSLVNFRGCGSDGNNHDQLSVNAAGTVITFTPKHNFYGKAQFGFNLADKHEKGGFVIYTIDVKRGNNVRVDSGSNLVLNGTFESGTEVKQPGREDVNNSTSTFNNVREGRLMGMHFSDSHPHDWYSHPWFPMGGGAAVYHAFNACDSSALYYGYGIFHNSFPNTPGFLSIPDFDHVMPPYGGSRYLLVDAWRPGYFYLGDDVKSCKRYLLEFDAYCTKTRPGYDFNVGFTDDTTTDFTNMDHASSATPKLIDTLFPAPNKDFTPVWRHYSIPLYYCGSKPANILFIRPMAGTILLDNLSLKQTELPGIAIKDSIMTPCSNHRLAARTLDTTKYFCDKFQYLWTSGTDTLGRDSLLFVFPHVTTTYKVRVNTGCNVFYDSVTITGVPGPTVVARDTSACKGSSVKMSVSVTGTGIITYDWSPAGLFDYTYLKEPNASPTKDTTVWLTVTDASACVTIPVKIKVNNPPNVPAFNSYYCYGDDSVTLHPTGALTYTWAPSTGLSCSSCTNPKVAPAFKTIYVVTGTDVNGCTDTGLVTVRVGAKPYPAITVDQDTICEGSTVVLTAHNGVEYYWSTTLPTTVACYNCPSTTSEPTVTSKYFVGAIDTVGCVGLDSITVVVHPYPRGVYISAPDTAVCLYDSLALTAHGAVTYLWYPYPAMSCYACTVSKVSPASKTDYIVTGIDSFGCSANDTFSVSVRPLPTITASVDDTLVCAGSSTSLHATGTVLDYNWSPAGLVSCSTCSTTTVTPTTVGINWMKVTGTGANGCDNTDSVKMNVINCACASSTFGSGYYFIGSSISSNLSSGYYYVGGDITIYGNPTFSGAKIMVADGATITIADTTRLTLDSCHIFTCPTGTGLWKGFRLLTGASKSGRIQVVNNTLIEDADTAIATTNPRLPSSGNIITVDNAVFNRNRIGVSINNVAFSSVSTYPFLVRNAVFTSRVFNSSSMSGYPFTWTSAGALRAKVSNGAAAPYNLSKNFTKAALKDGTTAYAGIRLRRMGDIPGSGSSYREIIIGDGADTNYTNMFDFLGYGIDGYFVNATLYNNVFTNIGRLNAAGSSSGLGGIAVSMGTDFPPASGMRSRLQLLPYSGPNYVTTNTFYDCIFGVLAAEVYESRIERAYITSSRVSGSLAPGGLASTDGTGIMTRNHSYKSIKLLKNAIYNLHYGIQNYTNGSTTTFTNGNVNIDTNTLRGRNPDLPWSVSSGQYMSKAISAMNVIGSCVGCGASTGTVKIQGNTIDSVYNGIEANGFRVQRCSTFNNYVRLVKDPAGSLQSGIYSAGTTSGTVNVNTVTTATALNSDDRINAYYSVNNSNLFIRANASANAGYGFRFVGTQPGTTWYCNTMSGNFAGGLALDGVIGQQGNFPDAGAADNQWLNSWSQNQTITLNSCNSAFSKIYVRTTTGYRPTFHNSKPLLLLSQYTNGSTVIDKPGAFVSPCNVQTFKPTTGKTGSLFIGIAGGGIVFDDRPEVNNWIAQYLIYSSLKADSALIDSSATLAKFLSFANDSTTFDWITDIEDALSDGDTTTVEALLNSPVPHLGVVTVDTDVMITDQPEASYVVQNYVDFYTQYLGLIKGSYVDTPTIESLAGLCPASNGPVVLQARALLAALTGINESYDDDSLCATGGNERSLTVSLSQCYGLYPNPNDGNFTVRQMTVSSEPVKAEVFNLMGIRVFQGSLNFAGGIVNLQIGDVAPGMYFLHLQDKKGNYTIKFNKQ